MWTRCFIAVPIWQQWASKGYNYERVKCGCSGYPPDQTIGVVGFADGVGDMSTDLPARRPSSPSDRRLSRSPGQTHLAGDNVDVS